MKVFIKKQQFNFINKQLQDFKKNLKFCGDEMILNANKLTIEENILKLFDELLEEEKQLLRLDGINEPKDVDEYLNKIYEYTYGMALVSEPKIKKIFKKEKKLKMPSQDLLNQKNVYLGWRDEGSKKQYVIYKVDDELLGMACRVQVDKSNNMNICKFCNYTSNKGDVSFVSPVCKSKGEDDYHSLGFGLCSDSDKCNERIISVDHLEALVKKVNNL